MSLFAKLLRLNRSRWRANLKGLQDRLWKTKTVPKIRTLVAVCLGVNDDVVLKGPLHLFSKDPPTGFYRDGYCRTGKEDEGNHAIAGLVTDEFLDFSASKGNNLKDKGIKGGMKWCLCTHRWKEAFDAAQKGDLSKAAVPKVYVHATHESALKQVSYSDLNKYAADGEAPNQSSRQQTHVQDGSKTSSVGMKTIEGEQHPNAPGGDHNQKVGGGG